MKSSTMRIGKRIMAAMLSLMMVAGIFAGMKLDVRAGDTYTFDVTKPEDIEDAKIKTYQPYDIFQFDNITIPDNNTYIFEVRYDFYYHGKLCGHKLDYLQTASGKKDKLYNYYISFPDADAMGYSNASIEYHLQSTDLPIKSSGEGEGKVIVIITVFNVTVSGIDIPVPSEDVVAPSHERNFAPSHECNFQWVTTIDPEVGMDGLEEYKCAGCGAVQGSHPIPASVAAVKDFYGKVKDAPANGTVTYDSGKLYTISDYLLKKMSERNDVTLTVNFEYRNAKYELTFPAGTDYTSVLTDEETMYGYFGVAAKLGLTVVAK